MKTPFKRNEFEPHEEIAQTWALRYAHCPVCGEVEKNHCLLLTDPLVVFENKSAEKEFKRSLRLAEKNSEWLILPNDIIDNGFRASRIQPADIWYAQGIYYGRRRSAKSLYATIQGILIRF